MKNSKYQISNIKCLREVPCSVFCVLCSVFCTRAAARPAFTYDVALNSTYDNNIFEYSPRDESIFTYRFNQGVNPRRFAWVRSLDDLALDIALRGGWNPSVVRHHTTSIELAFTGHQYVSNPQKSYFSAAAHLRQYWARRAYGEASYELIPYYLIRNYRDLDGSSTYSPCAFAEQLVTVKAEVPVFRAVQFGPFVRYEIDDYQAPFQVYDTKAWRTGTDLSLTPLPFLGIGATYEYKAAQAVGPSPDISYDQHAVSATLGPQWRSLRLDLGFSQTWRFYTTTKAQDTTHAGRVDAIIAPAARATLRLGSRFSLIGDLGWESRSSTAPYRSDIDEVKNYTEWRAGLGIRHGGM